MKPSLIPPVTRLEHCSNISPLLSKLRAWYRAGLAPTTRPDCRLCQSRAHITLIQAPALGAGLWVCHLALIITHLTNMLTSAAEPHRTAVRLWLIIAKHNYAKIHIRCTLSATLALGTEGHFLLTDPFHLVDTRGLDFPALQDLAHHSPSLGTGM